MKTLLVLTVVALLVSACSASGPTETPTTETATTTLPGGEQLKILRVSTLSFSTGETYLVLDYLSNLPMDDTTALEQEADEIWVSFRAEAEKAQMKHALIRANDSLDKFTKSFGTYAGKTYGSVYDQAEDGTWSRHIRGS